MAAETASVLLDAGVGALEEIESKRQQGEKLSGDAERLRQETTDLDRLADSMFESSSALSSLRRELATLTEQLVARNGGAPTVQSEILAEDREGRNGSTLREQERIENARRVRDTLQTERFRQVALCASRRAQADSAVAERGDAPAPSAAAQVAVVDESRWRAAEAQIVTLRHESQQLAALPFGSSVEKSETALSEAKNEVALAERRSEDRRRERQAVADDLARAHARLELALRAAEAISLPDIQQRITEAQAAVGPDVESSDIASARTRHEQAKERVSSAAATVELLAGGIPAARRKCEALESTLASDAAAELINADEEERRLHAALLDAETEVPHTTDHVSPSAQELRDAATAKRDQLRANAERARGELEACDRQTLGMDVEGPRASSRRHARHLPSCIQCPR